MKHAPTALLLLLLLLLAACGESHEQMVLQLEELERQNRADSVMRNDSLALRLADYFDRHGSSNERLRAHYILGRTYADLGEAPAAISAYLDAADCADTTRADCDYRTLGCVYSQMGDVFHLQLLLTDEIEARQKSCQYALLAGDTLGALSSRKLSAGAYLLLGEESVAESILLDVLPLYEKYGYVQQGIQSSLMLMYIYVNHPEHASDLANLIRRYDTESTLFDKEHELPSQKRIYYYYKGKYFENVNQLDSAELYYRKVYYPDMAYAARNSMYGGLLSVFQKCHQADSIAKYAQLYCQANDSSIALNDQQLTAKLAASYQYNRHKQIAEKERTNAQKTREVLFVIVFFTLVLLIAIILVFFAYRRVQCLKLANYQQLLNSLEREQTELMELRTKEDAAFASVLERKDKMIDSLQRQVTRFQENRISESTVLEDRLDSSDIVIQLRGYLKENPPCEATSEEFRQLKNLINETIPSFYDKMKELRPIEYEICLLIRTHFAPAEISKLTGRSNDYITTTRKRILKKVYAKEGSAKELDSLILAIR